MSQGIQPAVKLRFFTRTAGHAMLGVGDITQITAELLRV